MLLMTSAEVVSVARLGSKLGGSVLTFIFSTLPSASSPPQPATTLAPATNTTIKITPSHTCLHLFKIIPPLYQVPERLFAPQAPRACSTRNPKTMVTTKNRTANATVRRSRFFSTAPDPPNAPPPAPPKEDDSPPPLPEWRNMRTSSPAPQIRSTAKNT